MSVTKELKKIKKIYGENFMHLCRELFPTILEQEGTLLKILEQKFAPNCNSLYESIMKNRLEVDFKEAIYKEFNKNREEKDEEKKEEETRTPYEILKEAGYTLYECKTEKDIQKFEKYYDPDEVLCTIYNGGRLKTRDCFFAVKENVEEIQRKDFKNPKKDDKYSTSVLGIQFTRKRNSTVEIISRYNHTVGNPNCTLGNNLDKLAPGLKQSFSNLLAERGLEFTSSNEEKFSIPGYTVAEDGKYYKYYMEIDGTYYCPGNIVISNGEAKSVSNPEEGLLIDYFFVDLKNKKIELCGDIQWEGNKLKDSFIDGLQEIEKIEVLKSKEDTQQGLEKIIKIYQKGRKTPAIIGIDKDNQIVTYENKNITQIGDNFLCYNHKLSDIQLDNVTTIGNNFLQDNKELTELAFPNLKVVEDNFLKRNGKLNKIDVPSLEKIGDFFLGDNEGLTEINFPSLEEVGNRFLYLNENLCNIEMSKLKKVGYSFLYGNRRLTKVVFPNLKSVGNDFLSNNKNLREMEVPRLENVGCFFLDSNKSLQQQILNLIKMKKFQVEAKKEERQDIKTIDSNGIVDLEREHKITKSEINFVRKIFEKIKHLFRSKKDIER